MTTERYIYQPGTILLLEQGEYSDFGYCAQLVTLTQLDLRKAIEEYKAQYKPEGDWDTPDQSGFAGWLCSTQQCAGLNCQTAHIGGYSDLGLPS